MTASQRPYIFIDTSSLLDSCWNETVNKNSQSELVYSKEKAETFWNHEFQSLETMGDIIIPARNIEELIKHSNNKKKRHLAIRAKTIIQKLLKLLDANRIQVVGDPNDPFADAILLSIALKFRTQNNMAFITQDRSLAKDLETIRHFESVRPRKGCDIKIRRIDRDGALVEHRGLENPQKTTSESPLIAKKYAARNEKVRTNNWWD